MYIDSIVMIKNGILIPKQYVNVQLHFRRIKHIEYGILVLIFFLTTLYHNHFINRFLTELLTYIKLIFL